jgi:hypothetical protein
MAYSTYLRRFWAPALLPIVAIFAIGIYIQPLAGDLARLGGVSARDFGWNAPQPVVQVRSNASADPVVLVAGDSFSAGNVWQTAAGVEILSFHWKAIGGAGCVENWLAGLKAQYPSARVVILETVERNFVAVFSPGKTACASRTVPPPSAGEPYATPAERSHFPKELLPDAKYAINALANGFKKFQATTRVGDAYLTPLIRSDLFSNRRSDLLLYYREDFLKEQWTPEEVRRAAGNAKRLEELASGLGLKLVVAVVPDKSTLYREFAAPGQFPKSPVDPWDELSAQGVTQVRLRDRLRESLETDTYFPDDTHLSPRGYIVMGKAIAERLRTFL